MTTSKNKYLLPEEEFFKFADDCEKFKEGKIDRLNLKYEDIPYSKPSKQVLKGKIESDDYFLFFRYQTSSSYMKPTTRKYIIELYKHIKYPILIYKEWRPSAWEDEPYGIERFKDTDPEIYQKVLKWGKSIKYGIIHGSYKIFNIINDLPKPEDLKEVVIYDGPMSKLEIFSNDKTITYEWMMLDDESKYFEDKIEEIIEIAKE